MTTADTEMICKNLNLLLLAGGLLLGPIPQGLAHPLGRLPAPSKLSSWYKGRRVHRDQCQAGRAGRVHLAWTPAKRIFNIARASNKKRPRSKGSCRTTRHGNRQECGATFGKFDTSSGTTAADNNANDFA
jgi:hypothetical protein